MTIIFPMSILTFSFVRVRRLLIKYQEDKYKDIKTALWLYYLFDMLVYALHILAIISVIFDSPYAEYIGVSIEFL